MKSFLLGCLLLLLIACDSEPASVVEPTAELSRELSRELSSELSRESAGQTASFRVGNSEIRAEMMELFEAAGLEVSLNADNSFTYDVKDGELIDTIGSDVILTYIRRN